MHLKDDTGAVNELHRVLRRTGLVVITVPADMKLWSDWDATLADDLPFCGFEKFRRLAEIIATLM